MGTITKSIGSAGGRDYSTVQAWEDALPANLVTDGNSQIGECYNDSEFTVAGVVVAFGGETTDSTHTITLRAASGQGFSDNASAQSNALFYNASNGVALRSTSASTTCITMSTVTNLFLTGLQIKGGSDGHGIQSIAGTNSLTIDKCIIHCNQTADNSARLVNIGGTVVITNTLLFSNHQLNGLAHANGTNGLTAEFVTSVNLGGQTLFGLWSNYGACDVKNSLVYNSGTPCNAGGTRTSTTNQCDNGSGGTGFTTQTAASQFVNTSTDFRLTVGAPAQAAATADTTYPTDIVNTARPQGSNWDIGAWELVVASSLPPGATMM